MPRQRKSVLETAQTGDRKATLTALRDRLAEAIDGSTDAAELSSLALRLTRVLEQLHELGGAEKPKEGGDDLESKRAAKLRAAAGS